MEQTKGNEFKNYIRKSKYAIIIISLFALLAFGQRIISDSFSIDVEIYIHNNNIGNTVNWDWWTSLNRWGLVWFNQITQTNGFPIFVANFITVVTMVAYSIAFNYLFYKNMKEEYQANFLKYQFVFPILFLTNPIFAEQYNFVHQNMGVAIGILMIPLALLLFQKAKEINHKLIKIALYSLGILMTVISFGVYQSIILIYIATVVVCYFLKVQKENDNNWKYLFTQIGLFAIIVLIYQIISKLTGEKATYLQIIWFKEEFWICLRNIFYVIKETIKCQGMFYNIGYVLALISWIILAIYWIVKKKMKIGLAISLLGIAIAPFYIMMVTGVNQLYRTQFNYSYAVGIMLMLAITFLNKNIKVIQTTKAILVILVLMVAYRQTYTTANLFNTADVVYKNDVKIADKIVDRIEQKEWYDENKDYTLIFVGTYEQPSMEIYLKGEIIGRSFFEFGKEDYCGISGRANLFLDILGYHFEMPTSEEFDRAKQYVQDNNISSWPNDKSIALMEEDNIVVRLSEEIN